MHFLILLYLSSAEQKIDGEGSMKTLGKMESRKAAFVERYHFAKITNHPPKAISRPMRFAWWRRYYFAVNRCYLHFFRHCLLIQNVRNTAADPIIAPGKYDTESQYWKITTKCLILKYIKMYPNCIWMYSICIQVYQNLSKRKTIA